MQRNIKCCFCSSYRRIDHSKRGKKRLITLWGVGEAPVENRREKVEGIEGESGNRSDAGCCGQRLAEQVVLTYLSAWSRQ